MISHQPSYRVASLTRPAHESTLERPDFGDCPKVVAGSTLIGRGAADACGRSPER